jgi:hypothetical protein
MGRSQLHTGFSSALGKWEDCKRTIFLRQLIKTKLLNMLQKFISTNESYATTFLRIMLGLLLLPHGAQKMLGWFGGYGFSGTMNFFTGIAGLPWIIGNFLGLSS